MWLKTYKSIVKISNYGTASSLGGSITSRDWHDERGGRDGCVIEQYTMDSSMF